MTFLHPALLPLLALAAVPVALHLLTLHRLRTVELSTFRFLFDSYVQQRRRMKFLEALLAALRALFVAGLVLLVCRPAVRHWGALFGGGGTGREVVLMVDTSASMNARAGGITAMERAKDAARRVAERLGKDDRVTLVRVAAKPEEVFSRFGADAEAIRARIDGLQAGPSRANFFAALAEVFGRREMTGGAPIVYVFTDVQASGWREVKDQGLGRVVPDQTKVFVVNVGTAEPMANRGVVGETPRPSQAIAGLPVVFRPRVVNHSKTQPADVTVAVILDENEVARASMTLKPGETATKELIHVPAEPGAVRGRFEIAADRFPDDDSFLFTLAVAPPVKVLLINGRPSNDPFENGALYLRTALTTTASDDEVASPADPKPRKVPGREFARSLDVREINEAEYNPDVYLRDAAAVVLADCGNLNDHQLASLRDYVAGGGGLIVFPGERVNADRYNKQFFTTPGPVGAMLTAATLGPPEGDPNAETFERLGAIDFAHPVFAVFDDPESRFFSAAKFTRRFPISLPATKGNTWPLAKFADGPPALVESRFGDGLMLLAAFPADAKWSNLPLKPEFVPLVLRIVAHVRRGPEVVAPSAVPPEAPAPVVVAGNWAPASGQVTDVKGRNTAIDFERSSSKLLGEFDRTTEKGYYAVEVRGGRSESPKAAQAAFAVNLAPDESDFAAVTESQLQDWLPGAEVTLVDASSEAQQSHGALGDEREIWRPLILIMFAVIGAEFLLATAGGRRAEGEDGASPRRLRDLTPGAWVGRMTGAEAPPTS